MDNSLRLDRSNSISSNVDSESNKLIDVNKNLNDETNEIILIQNETENQYQEKTLESIKDLFTDPNYFILGHGTGCGDYGKKAVSSIFEGGLRTSHGSLYYTSIGLCNGIDDISSLKNQLDNWKHLNSKNIILLRLPLDYINMDGDMSDLDGTRFGAFYDKKIVGGKEVNYVSSKFIIGCYDVENSDVKINPNFEPELSEESKQVTLERYEATIKLNNERLRAVEKNDYIW